MAVKNSVKVTDGVVGVITSMPDLRKIAKDKRDGLVDVLNEANKKIATYGADIMRKEMLVADSSGHGMSPRSHLYQSVTSEFFGDLDKKHVESRIFFKDATNHYGDSYVVAADKGRSPGEKPPFYAIQDWAERNQLDTSDKFIRNIQKKIQRKGTPKKGFLQRAARQIGKRANQLVDLAIKNYKNDKRKNS